jgi:hypothetical protein
MNFLFRSMDRGETWTRISGDLTYNDPAKYGDIPYQTLFSIAESPYQFGLIYVGTDDGRIWRTDDSGSTWTEIDDGVPVAWVAELVASEHANATVYMAQNGKRDDNFTPYLWKSTDFGETWTSIVNNLPIGPVNTIREDPRNPDILYVGTDIGVYVTLDGGREWHTLGGNLPSTFVHDLQVHPREDILVAATHGRGIYAMDVRPIQGLSSDVRSAALHLFDIDEARLPQGFRSFGGGGGSAFFQYWVGRAGGGARIVIQDDTGAIVRELSGPAEAGLNGVAWDLSREPGDSSAPRSRFRVNRVNPGTYTVTVTVGGTSTDGALRVVR